MPSAQRTPRWNSLNVTKNISLPATIKTQNGSIKVAAEFAINRQDFGIKYPGRLDDLIEDDVAIKLRIAANEPLQYTATPLAHQPQPETRAR